MKSAMSVLVAWLMGASLALAQTGQVVGTVQDEGGSPVGQAWVTLHPVAGGSDMETTSDTQGGFSFDAVPVGAYEIDAMAMGHGRADQDVDVADGETVNVTLVLTMGGGGHQGGCDPFEAELDTLHGWILENDWMGFTHYSLDFENDGSADVLLGFGPPGYEPPSGATLPSEGDEVDIIGGSMGMMDPEMVMVYYLNGELWFEPDGMGHHNGNGGSWHDGHGCNWEDPVTVSASGYAQVVEMPMDFHDGYFLDTDDDGSGDYRLSFGAPDYEPESGAQRPADGDWVEIVGGLIEGCPVAPTIVVYEINGLVWRTPGDTTGLTDDALSVEEPSTSAQPVSPMLASAYPNPFNPGTTVQVTLRDAGPVRVAVYDLLGREVATLQDGTLAAGSHRFAFDGRSLATGTYLVRVDAGDVSRTLRVQLVK